MKKMRVVIRGDVYSITEEQFEDLYTDFCQYGVDSHMDLWDWLDDKVNTDRYKMTKVGRFPEEDAVKVRVGSRVFLIPKKDYFEYFYNYSHEDGKPGLPFESWLEKKLSDDALLRMGAAKLDGGVVLTFTTVIRVSKEVYEKLEQEYENYRLTTMNPMPLTFTDCFDPDELVEKYGAEKISGF